MNETSPVLRFPRPLGEWLRGAGPQNDIVVSTRVRMARNIRGYPFTGRASKKQLAEILQAVTGAFSKIHLTRSVVNLRMDELSELQRDVLVERHLVSRELSSASWPRAVLFGRGEMLSVMVNEEDHLRLQWVKAGFDVDRAFRALRKVDVALETALPYAVSERYGYLTACPTNVGTGMRISVMLHLPALTVSEHIEKVFRAAQKMNHAIRGFYGEGTRAFGDFYQISNQTTLGRTEEEILDNVKAIVPKVLEYERRARGTLYAEQRAMVEDRVLRALALLRSARRLNVQEMMGHLSMVRLGIDLGIVANVDLAAVNELFLSGQPAHLQMNHGEEISSAEGEILRAEMVRGRLAAATN